jgi:hypothetical protein
MKRENKPKPYIDYKTAKTLDRMYDFIIHANEMRSSMCDELNRIIATLQQAKLCLAPVEKPENQYAHFSYDHFTHDIARLRADAWEAGLTHTLFEKLKDKQFKDRFLGGHGEPVQKEEIEERFFDENGEFLEPPEKKGSVASA